MLAIALWIVLAGLMLVAFKNGRMPTWAAIPRLVLLPLSAMASFTRRTFTPNMAAGRYRPNAGAPVFAAPTTLWTRQFRTAVEGAAGHIGASDLPVRHRASARSGRPISINSPHRRGMRRGRLPTTTCAPSRKGSQRKTGRVMKPKIRRSRPRLRTLRDYSEYLNGSDPAPACMEGARHARSRQADATALLGERDRLVDLREYWQLNIEADAGSVPGLRRRAAQANALKIDPPTAIVSARRSISNSSPANLKWLVRTAIAICATGAETTLHGALRMSADSSRIDRLADTLEHWRGRNDPFQHHAAAVRARISSLGLTSWEPAVDRYRRDQHRGEHAEQGAVGGFGAGAVGQRLKGTDDDSAESVCMQATPEHHGGVDRGDAAPDQPVRKNAAACAITMVLEALKKPMPTMAPDLALRIGGCDASASVARMEMITRLPLTAIHLRVSRGDPAGEGEHAELIGDDGGNRTLPASIGPRPCTSRRNGPPHRPCTVKVQA